MSKPNADYELIFNLIKEGLTMNQIHVRTGVSMSYLDKNYSAYYRTEKLNKLGHKDEPYYKTEKEMLEDKVYTYESLSTSEKEIYDNLNKGEI
jgi:predicted transcriptional regulator